MVGEENREEAKREGKGREGKLGGERALIEGRGGGVI